MSEKQRLRVSTSITSTAVLDFSRETVLYLARLLEAERRSRGTRRATRRLGAFRQAVLVLRWLLDDTPIAQLAADNGISGRTCHRYVLEGIAVLKAQAPTLEQAIERAKAAGHTHVMLDGTLIETDRCRVPGPSVGADLWWSGKHKRHGGNIQVLSAPDGRTVAVNSSLDDLRCPATPDTFWPGGFLLTEQTACLPLDVRVLGEPRERHVVISVFHRSCG